MTAKLLFASGFENGVALDAPGAGNQGLSGADSTTGFAWPPSVWGGGAALQLLDGSFINRIETVIGHDGTPTHALFQSVTGASGGDAQDPLVFTPTATLAQEGDLYSSEWVKFQPDLATQLFPGQDSSGNWGNWRALFEWKTGGQGANYGGDYRVKVSVDMDNSGHLFWSSAGDNNANGPYPFQTFWQTDNHTVPVVAGQWFHLETFTHRSAGADGEFWAKIDGQTIVDHQGPNIGVHGDPINRVMLAQDYTGGHLPASQWVDDVQLWDGAPLSNNVAHGVTGSVAPGTVAAGGQQTLMLRVAEDAWQGDAQFTVAVDGKAVGGVHTATASHAAGQWQDVALTGNFGATGPSEVAVNYINDTSGGTVATDRNLYVQGLDANGHHFAGASATNTASLGGTDPAAAHMVINGSLTFHLFF
jgi:predicted xylan-binding protein with Ca-dependent carbohydrate-binding module